MDWWLRIRVTRLQCSRLGILMSRLWRMIGLVNVIGDLNLDRGRTRVRLVSRVGRWISLCLDVSPASLCSDRGGFGVASVVLELCDTTYRTASLERNGLRDVCVLSSRRARSTLPLLC